MHFGFARKQNGGFEKRLRSLEDGALLNGKGALVDVAMRSEPLRVVNLAETVRNIQKGLGILPIQKQASKSVSIPVKCQPSGGSVPYYGS